VRACAAAAVFLSLDPSRGAAQPTPEPLSSHASSKQIFPFFPRPHVTFSNQVARLLQAHCQTCHHDGGIAPFPLVTYADAYANRVQIAAMTEARKMPPWKAAPDCRTSRS